MFHSAPSMKRSQKHEDRIIRANIHSSHINNVDIVLCVTDIHRKMVAVCNIEIHFAYEH